MGERDGLELLRFSKPILPSFHHSTIPGALFERPLFQSFIVSFAADPLPSFFIEEKRDTAAIAFVILPHDLRIRFVVPDLKLSDADPFFTL